MSVAPSSIPAVVTAGDRGAARSIYGQSKLYLEIGDRPLVAHVVAVLQAVPEVSEVWLIGDAERLRGLFAPEEIRRELRKPLHIIDQFRNLYENVWESYRRLLPGAGDEGRNPEGADLDVRVLYLSGDLPFATPLEISAFVRRSLELDCDYAMGLVTEESMEAFYPAAPGEPGIRMAYYNLREGRFRQSNLHLVRPANLGNRCYVQDMYEHRYQKQTGQIIALAWELLTSERGGVRVLVYYLMMHVGSILDRNGFRNLADRVRRWIPMARIERGVSELLRTKFRMVVTEAGGCGVDIDSEHDYEVAKLRFPEWEKAQLEAAAKVYGPRALPTDTEERSGD